MQTKSKFNLTDIKLSVIAKAPFITPILSQMRARDEEFFTSKGKPESVPGVSDNAGNFWIDLNYDGSKEQLETILMHECCHILQNHINRSLAVGFDDPELINMAGDLTINDAIRGTFTKIPNGLYQKDINERLHTTNIDPIKSGDSFESIYEKLKQLQREQKQTTNSDGSQDSMPQGNCQHVQSDDLDTSETDKANMEAAIQQSLNELAKSSDAPSQLRDYAKLTLQQSEVNWPQVIRKAIKSNLDSVSGKPQRSYRRTNRRQSAADKLLLPGTIHTKTKVLIAVDTSASMGEAKPNKPLGIAISEVFKATHIAQVHGFSVTTNDSDVQRIRTKADLHKLLTQTGGTDMRIAFEVAEERDEKLILLTDGETPWPEEQPSIPHLVLVINDDLKYVNIPDHINWIHIKGKGD